MIALIILVHNQSQYLLDLEQALLQQTRQPDKIVFVVDRCLADFQAATSIAEKHTNWLALHVNLDQLETSSCLIGKSRDAALKLVPDYNVIFTDADCTPSPRLIEHHAKYLENDSEIIATAGVRISINQDGSQSGDIRLTEMPFRRTSFNPDVDRIALSEQADNPMVLFGCNFGLNLRAIECIKQIHKNIFNEDRVFSSVFDSAWGYEESSLGPLLYNQGGKLILLATEQSNVTHHWHNSRKTDTQARTASQYINKTCLCPVTITKNSYNCYNAVSNLPQWLTSILKEYTQREQAEIADCLYQRATKVAGTEKTDPNNINKVTQFLNKHRFYVEVPNDGTQIEKTESCRVLPKTAYTSCDATVVLPMHNQENNVDRILTALSQQSKLPKELIIVADRCTDGTTAKIRNIQSTLPFETTLRIRCPTEEGFRAGQVRNDGIDQAKATNILMLDGDCVPAPRWVEAHMDILEKATVPCATFGIRHDQIEEASPNTRSDTRTYRTTIPIFARTEARVTTFKGVIYGGMGTWSCNLGLNKAAVMLLKQLNNGSVFSNQLTQGVWGGEDTYLGMQLWDNWAMCVATNPEKGSVYHIWHSRYSGKVGTDHMLRLKHSQIPTMFYRNKTRLTNIADTEIQLLATHTIKDLPGVYKLYIDNALKYSPDEVTTQKALAYYLARTVVFEECPKGTQEQLQTDAMYKELCRIRDLVAMTKIDMLDYQEALKDKITLQF